MAKSKHRLNKRKKSNRSFKKRANSKLASKKIEKEKPHNRAVLALLNTVAVKKSKGIKIISSFRATAKVIKAKWEMIAAPVKTFVIAVKGKCNKAISKAKFTATKIKSKWLKAITVIKSSLAVAKAKKHKAVGTIKAITNAAKDKLIKSIASIKAVLALMRTKWLPIAGIMFWNYIIAPVIAAGIVIKSKLRYMVVAILLITLPIVVITVTGIFFSSNDSDGAIPAIFVANTADENEVSSTDNPAEADTTIQNKTFDSKSETGLSVTILVCGLGILILTALVLWVVIPRKSDPLVPIEEDRDK